jgi:hypothetical protein
MSQSVILVKKRVVRQAFVIPRECQLITRPVAMAVTIEGSAILLTKARSHGENPWKLLTFLLQNFERRQLKRRKRKLIW